MEKLQSFMDKYMLPFAMRINDISFVAALRDAFTLMFPLTMAGSLVLLINYVVLSPDGFIASLLHLSDLIPNLADYQAVLSPVITGTNNIMSILIVFLCAYKMADELNGDKVLCGITAVSCFFILYPASREFVDGGSGLSTTYFGAQGLFVAILVGCLSTWVVVKLQANKKLRIKMPDEVPPAVARSFNNLIPIVLDLMLFSILNYVFTRITPEGIQVLIYNTIQAPLTSLGSSIGTILVFCFVQQLLWIVGIHGPNTLSAIRQVIFMEQQAVNLEYVAANGSAWGAPYPVNWSSINDAFANIGGSGCTLGLILAILLAGRKNKTNMEIAKLSLAPGLFNINEPLIFGLPIVMNPFYMIPFILSPIICNILGYLAVVVFQIMPPVAYSVAWTTPGFLIPFLGSGGNSITALLMGFVCTGVSTLVYLPFVLAENRVAVKDEEEAEDSMITLSENEQGI